MQERETPYHPRLQPYIVIIRRYSLHIYIYINLHLHPQHAETPSVGQMEMLGRRALPMATERMATTRGNAFRTINASESCL